MDNDDDWYDDDDDIYPYAEETRDGVDEDCDGVADDDAEVCAPSSGPGRPTGTATVGRSGATPETTARTTAITW